MIETTTTADRIDGTRKRYVARCESCDLVSDSRYNPNAANRVLADLHVLAGTTHDAPEAPTAWIEIPRRELREGDVMRLHGYIGQVGPITYEGNHIIAVGNEYTEPHQDEPGGCTQRFTITSGPEHADPMPGGYNGGTYGNCVIAVPTVRIAARD